MSALPVPIQTHSASVFKVNLFRFTFKNRPIHCLIDNVLLRPEGSIFIFSTELLQVNVAVSFPVPIILKSKLKSSLANVFAFASLRVPSTKLPRNATKYCNTITK